MNGLKIGAVQMRVYPGEISRNASFILREMGKRREQGLDLLVFPELCLSGYLIGDMWERPAFLRENEYWMNRIVAAADATAVLFGTVITDWAAHGEDGRPRKFNGAVLARQGKSIVNPALGRPWFVKTLLPNYREFDETRHFCDLRKLALETGTSLPALTSPVGLHFGKKRIRLGITLCEDGWSDEYTQKPFELLKQKRAQVILNLSCSPFTLGKKEKRRRLFSDQARRLGLPLLYVNAVGIQNNAKTIFTFDGTSSAYDASGSKVFEAPSYVARTTMVNLPLGIVNAGPESPAKVPASRRKQKKYREIYQALAYGAKAYLQQSGLKKVVVGLSGGIDSAVTAALYGSLLRGDNLLLVNMPSRFNSPVTRHLSAELARNLNCFYTSISIEPSVSLTRRQVHNLRVTSPDKKKRKILKLTDFHFENIQARDRSSRILAALASAFGGVFTCNGNKAESTVGYATLYGDLSGFLALIGDLWKEDVYGLGRYLNERVFRREVIPGGIFQIPPSAELSPAQDIGQGAGDPLHYPYHDKLFFSWIQHWNRVTPEEILAWYRDGSLKTRLGCESVDLNGLFPTPAHFVADLEKWWELYNGMGVAKRVQTPPVLALSSRAFGFDHREHLGKPFYTTAYLEMKREMLKKPHSGKKVKRRP